MRYVGGWKNFKKRANSAVIVILFAALQYIIKETLKMKDVKVALLRPVFDNSEAGREINENSRAVARIKTTDGRKVVNLSVCGLNTKAGGNYYFFLEGNVPPFFQMFDLSGGEFSVLNENDIGATAVVFVAENKAIIDLYGTFSSNGMTAKEVQGYAETYFFSDALANGSTGFHGEKENEGTCGKTENYNDEMIAEENYYEYDDVDKINLKVNDACGEETENDGADEELFGKEEEKTNGAFSPENETCGFFFEKIRKDINEIFRDFPHEKNLEETVNESRFARVCYDGEKYYAVGVIYENKTPKYVCYGVPGKYGEKPDSITGYCSFIPISPFDLKGEGYFVMYQSALSGKRL